VLLTTFTQQYQQRIERCLNEKLSTYTEHGRLQSAMQYSLCNGGKRIRPLLAYASAKAIADISAATDVAAMSVEAIHAYSLIHDDLPAMDDDNLRRGQPTCHIAFNEETAILAGDALQAFAFEILATPAVESVSTTLDTQTQLAMIQTLAHASGAKGMVAGQSIDCHAVNHALSLTPLENMHRLKTGALINASIRLGALSTDLASDTQLAALDTFANAIGLAFQIQDDILDVTSDTKTLGKPQGADAKLSKPTYVSLLGLKKAQEKAEKLHQHALDALTSFDCRADNLRHLSNYIVNRSH
jgi:geranylgeranyl pyrophosphate synthase